MSETEEALLDEFSKAELAKIGVDYLKHISTLASGSIVVIATFLDKFPHPKFKPALICAVCALCLSLMFCCVGMLELLLYGAKSAARTLHLEKAIKRSFVFGIQAFTAGIFFIGLFAIFNLV